MKKAFNKCSDSIKKANKQLKKTFIYIGKKFDAAIKELGKQIENVFNSIFDKDKAKREKKK